MDRTRCALLALAVFVASATDAAAWGYEPHKYIAERVIPLLPVELRPFFERYRVFLIEHAIDPDLYRNVGFTEEPPNHFVDLDSYGPPPFTALPRDFDEAVRKYGLQKIRSEGTLPWRTAEMFGKLVKSFEQLRDPTAPYAFDDVKPFSAVLTHYVSDGFQPFHACKNYDGQLTGQTGIHARFEAELFRRFRSTLVFNPRPAVPVNNARDFMFGAMIDSFGYVDDLLEADRRAVAGRTEYDDEYFRRFFERARPVMERRMADAMTGVASIIAGAWVQAGRPAVPLEAPRPPNRKVRR